MYPGRIIDPKFVSFDPVDNDVVKVAVVFLPERMKGNRGFSEVKSFWRRPISKNLNLDTHPFMSRNFFKSPIDEPFSIKKYLVQDVIAIDLFSKNIEDRFYCADAASLPFNW